MLRRGITARDILTKEAFENAIAVVMAFGGSTNAVIHLLAIAGRCGIDLTLDAVPLAWTGPFYPGLTLPLKGKSTVCCYTDYITIYLYRNFIC